MRTVFLLWAILTSAACAGPESSTPTQIGDHGQTLSLVPHPGLAGAEPAVQEQILGLQKRLDELDSSLPPKTDALAQAYADLGLAYLLYDFTEAAEVCFGNSRRLVPDDFRWHYLLGYVNKLQGHIERAIPLLEASLELNPDFGPAMLRLGRAHFELGSVDQAGAWFKKALGRDPASAAALEGLGRISAATGDPATAVEYLQQALAEEPGASSLHYALGQAYRSLGKLDQARRELEQSGDAAVPIRDPIISPLALIGESAQFYLVQGGEALEDGNYQVAVGAYRRALEKDQGSFVAYKGLSYALEKLGDLDGAILNLHEALVRSTTGELDKEGGERAEIHRVIGGLESLRQRDEEAIRQYSRSLELVPEQPGVRMKIANALARSGRFEEALPHFNELLRSSPEHAAEVLVKRATALVNLNRKREALEDFRRALELRPEDGRLRLRYAEALEHWGESRMAQHQRQRATGAAVESAGRIPVLLTEAVEKTRRGDAEAALALLSQILKLDSSRTDVRHRRGTLLGHLGRYDEAVFDFRRVIEEEPRHAGAWHGEINSLILAQRYGEARVRLNEALRIFSLDARLAHIQARLLASSPDTRVRDGRLALAVAQRLVAAVDQPRVHETLAMAHAESGSFQEAAELQRALVARAERDGNATLAADFRRKLQAFESGKPWFASGPQEILDAALGGA